MWYTLASDIRMSEWEFVEVAQYIIVKFLLSKSLRSTKILRRLQEQFEEISRRKPKYRMCTDNLWKAEQRLKTHVTSGTLDHFWLRKTFAPFETISRVFPATVNYCTKLNVYIGRNYVNFQSEKWFCFMTMSSITANLIREKLKKTHCTIQAF